MKNLWDDSEEGARAKDLLAQRVYTSRLLGRDADLVLHGGGNTSVKISEKNRFGETEEIIYVKGSGWDLATIEPQGFSPVRLDVLKKMAKLEKLSDSDMVSMQRAAMTNPYAPNPSVEAILHAIIPFRFVDHTHADAIVAITNTPGGEDKIRSLYGDSMLIVPYIMPGFILARAIYLQTLKTDWSKLKGMILLNHGIFTFHDDAKTSYTMMIDAVTKAEDYISKKAGNPHQTNQSGQPIEPMELAQLRNMVSAAWGSAVLACPDSSPEQVKFSNLTNLPEIANRGPVTPDHIIRTKRVPMIAGNDMGKSLKDYTRKYLNYFHDHDNGKLTCLDPAPRWAILPGKGMVAFGRKYKDTAIIRDIAEHTIKVIQQAEGMGGWQALPEKDLFEMEYWELEQAKLKKSGAELPFTGKIAIVTGAASGIGKACVEALRAKGASVAALDISSMPFKDDVLKLKCDVTKVQEVRNAIHETVMHFGGLDLVISNAGIFPKSMSLKDMDQSVWSKSLEINLSSHERILNLAIPFLELGIDPAVIFIGSKNVPAPGPGQAAYSAAKAGMTQLARIASLELGSKGIRINVIHPNAVYDTGIWTDEVLKARALSYGISVKEYKTNNVLRTEVTSSDVAELACVMLGPVFSKITGAQVPIDGGNDRVI